MVIKFKYIFVKSTFLYFLTFRIFYWISKKPYTEIPLVQYQRIAHINDRIIFYKPQCIGHIWEWPLALNSSSGRVKDSNAEWEADKEHYGTGKISKMKFLSHEFDQFILTLERQLLLIEHFLKWLMMRSDSIHLFTLSCIGTLSYTHS